MKQRVVVFGAAGFVGAAIIKALNKDKYEAVPVTRKECDLADAKSVQAIKSLVKDGDIVVCAAAKAPAKNWDMLVENVAMITHFVEGLKDKKLAYLLNISSDAIYADSMAPLTESSLIAPLSAHGMMHCMREHILEKNLSAAIGHLRPTLIYGEDDPHNGYGPNSFIRAALANQRIELFGGGEEQRDHVYVGDVARIAARMIDEKAAYPVNAVTGQTRSFMEIAQAIKSAAPIEIASKPRSGPMPHNGYRAFSNDAARKLCPDLQPQDMTTYIRRMVGK